MENKNTTNSANTVKKSGVLDAKKIKRLIGLCVLVVLVIFLFGGLGRNKTIDSEIPSAEGLPTDQNIENPVADSASPSDVGRPTGGIKAPSLTYQQALDKYGSRRIQFDTNCQARPNNMTYKNGTEIMLDNRADVSRKIKIGSTYTLSSYGFKIVKLTASTFPQTYLVDCGTSQNVATIIVQK